MNIDLLKIRQNDHAKLLLDASASVGLTQIITKATRIQGTSFSLIDHIFTNVEDSWSAVLTDSFSDHFSTICHIANRSKKSANPVKKVRSFTQDNFEKFHTFLSHSSWQSVFASTCPEEAWQNFWNLFYTAFDLHFPFKIIKPNKGFIPIKGFMTPGLLVSRKEKLKLDLKRKTIPSEDTTALEKNKGTLTKSEDTIEFDMKGTRRNRDNQLEKIMGELCLETESTDTTDEDDLLALMDRAQ